MYKSTRFATAICVMLMLPACQQESTSAAGNTATPASATSSAIAAAPRANPLIVIEPASLPVCQPAAVTTVKWNVRGTRGNVTTVEIWAGVSSSDMKLFAEGGPVGEARTGAWTIPGTHFSIRNKADGESLGEVIEGGPKCK
ncbi:MAG: hypothetical protein KGJ32_09265 [Xanthomonadaceae bacterium]|nr:hypothetical protein [Xanthomonadaceae bacterium]